MADASATAKRLIAKTLATGLHAFFNELLFVGSGDPWLTSLLRGCSGTGERQRMRCGLSDVQAAMIAMASVAVIFAGQEQDVAAHPTHAAAPEVTVNARSGGRQDELPLDIEIDGNLVLIDQNGHPRPVRQMLEGKVSLVFFGYSSCDGICPTALPAMASAVELLAKRGVPAQPVLVTIDPERDTPEGLSERLSAVAPAFVGLTGPDSILKKARQMFHIKAEAVFEDDDGTVFKHGSFIYIVDPAANVVSFLPPILPPERIAEIAEGYY
ncbi:MAG: SCO family protein [Geminicoccaceae bacterium]